MTSNPELADLTPFYMDYEGDHENHWISRADLRMPFNVDSNHDVTAAVVKRIQATMPGLLRGVEFDSELSCFYAYGKTEQDCKDVIGVIISLISEVLEP